jgi:predicted transcriptional regulator
MAHGNLNNSVKGLDVFFKNVSTEAYERPSFGYQATNEIIQDLIQKGFIERDAPEYIRLTQRGLDKCKEDCH